MESVIFSYLRSFAMPPLDDRASAIILYDGCCGACSYFIGRRGALLRTFGFATAALQEYWVQSEVNVPAEELLKDIHLITKDGEVYRGPEAFRFIAKHIWWLKPLFVFSRLPLLEGLLNRLYRFIADRRTKISTVCGLQEKALYK
jgi:predicted DCC family thiol-disulfide oxidoreductase YuxK